MTELLENHTVSQMSFVSRIRKHLPPGINLHGGFDPYSQQGPAKTTWHTLKMLNRELPLFFCSCSPSDKENKHLLIKRVEENAITIRRQGEL